MNHSCSMIFLLGAAALSCFAAPNGKKNPQEKPIPELEKASIDINGYPKSVTVDADGNIYFACIGQTLSATDKDKDGYLGMIPYGSTEVKQLTGEEMLDAPKGILVRDGYLYCSDIDSVLKIDLKDGTISGYADLSPERTNALDDLAFINGRLMVSSPETDQIFYVDTDTHSYGELVPKGKLNKPTGLAWDPERKLIYVCEYARDEKGKPCGRLLSVNPVTREVTELSKDRGLFDGLVYRNGSLYFSDWSQDKKPEAVRRLDLKQGRSYPAATSAVESASDFAVHGSSLVVPGIREKKIHIMPIGGKNKSSSARTQTDE